MKTFNLFLVAIGIQLFAFKRQFQIQDIQKKNGVVTTIDFNKLGDELTKKYSASNRTAWGKSRFPGNTPAYALLFRDSAVTRENFYGPVTLPGSRKLSNRNMNLLLTALNDRNSFRSGEIVTTFVDYHVVFYDPNNQCVGLANISYDYAVYAFPTARYMKGGTLRTKAMNTLKHVCNQTWSGKMLLHN